MCYQQTIYEMRKPTIKSPGTVPIQSQSGRRRWGGNVLDGENGSTGPLSLYLRIVQKSRKNFCCLRSKWMGKMRKGRRAVGISSYSYFFLFFSGQPGEEFL